MENLKETTKTTESTKSTEITLKFIDMNLSDEVKRAVEAMGFESPSPIQAEAIPHLL